MGLGEVPYKFHTCSMFVCDMFVHFDAEHNFLVWWLKEHKVNVLWNVMQQMECEKLCVVTYGKAMYV